jgi:hypothetical protein
MDVQDGSRAETDLNGNGKLGNWGKTLETKMEAGD